MTDRELIEIHAKLNEFWPGQITVESFSDSWERPLSSRTKESVLAAIDKHLADVGTPPSVKEIMARVNETNARLAGGTAATRTQKYLEDMRAASRQARAEREAIDAKLAELPVAARNELIDRAISQLGQTYPNMAGYYAGRRDHILVKETAIQLLKQGGLKCAI